MTWTLVVFVMAFVLGLFTIRKAPGAESAPPIQIPEAQPVESTLDSLNVVLEILKMSPTGKSVVASALTHWGLRNSKELERFVRWGEVSRTDAVLTRRMDTVTGEESRSREVVVFLRRDQDTVSAALDLAHELTHAVEGPIWDPYDPTLTPGRYILTAIEGRGGEVEALVRECQVALEIGANARCQRYLEAGVVQKKRVVNDFYRVGDWHYDISKKLGAEGRLMPELSNHKPELYSSTGSAPYPVALYREYEDMRATACENTRKRMSLRRDPASENFMIQRCSDAVTVPAGGSTPAPVSNHAVGGAKRSG